MQLVTSASVRALSLFTCRHRLHMFREVLGRERVEDVAPQGASASHHHDCKPLASRPRAEWISRHVTYVPIDFNKTSLADALARTRYDPTLRTLIVWEGVVIARRQHRALRAALRYRLRRVFSKLRALGRLSSCIESTYARAKWEARPRSQKLAGECCRSRIKMTMS